LANYSVSN